ncbi:MAG: NAD(P)/FAD-dependent oxidoreductase [Herbiconiux sp.]|uniref:phytoene desaturase family protein n=1 Tax=Herbiconiux sp. TaxID=1871186 RepID=UPI0012100596|nr:NAD(P)/FAD-dependent oxidoreductase [Herbiconiux sp.]TAJ48280.1 MAG: NAD(P)/FAD-dependent oxidoreductase [Herbiconiux sp.]
MRAVDDFDVIVIGGGHNGLVAAAYLARAGRRVCLLERLEDVGGAAVSTYAFEGMDAKLSRYSYLVSLLPQKIVDELGLTIELRRRRYSSYTPLPGSDLGLLIDNDDPDATRASFDALGSSSDALAFDALGADLLRVAAALWPTVTEPLPTRSEVKRMLADDALWADLVERPIGAMIRERFADDLVRGVVATDSLIGTFASLDDPSLIQNICFLYHVIGRGTGDWDVPVGGMGAVTGELARAAREAGVDIRTGVEVVAVTPEGRVDFRDSDGVTRALTATRLLANVAPTVLAGLLGDRDIPSAEYAASDAPEGAQVKVNMLLKRLPRLRDPSVEPAAAFGGTFHINELASQLERAHEQAADGRIPHPLPAEIYCHSLTDPSILSPELQETGAQTLTVFGLHVPHRLVAEGVADAAALQTAIVASLDSVLAEPISDLLLTDANGAPCIETKTTADLERTLGMPGGNIFHGPLSWPFLDDDEPRGTAAERWGVATAHERILICGSGSRRGGAVSGLGGHSAAMAVLDDDLDRG